MVCDITSYAEVRAADGAWHPVGDVFPLDEFDRREFGRDLGPHPFVWHTYRQFGWLAGVRNYSAVEPLAEPRGLPDDLSQEIRTRADEDDGCFAHSWFTLAELLTVDYDAEVNDRRVSRHGNGGVTGSAKEGNRMPLRDFLGETYVERLDTLATLGEPSRVRVIFWFDD